MGNIHDKFSECGKWSKENKIQIDGAEGAIFFRVKEDISETVRPEWRQPACEDVREYSRKKVKYNHTKNAVLLEWFKNRRKSYMKGVQQVSGRVLDEIRKGRVWRLDATVNTLDFIQSDESSSENFKYRKDKIWLKFLKDCCGKCGEGL